MLASLLEVIYKYTGLVNKHLNTAACGLSLFLVYLFSQRWLELSLQNRTFQVFLVALSLLFIFISILDKHHIKNSFSALDFYWLPAILLISFHIIIGNPAYIQDIFIYLVGFTLLIIAKTDIINFMPAFKIIKIAALAYAVGAALQYIYTDVFNDWLFNYTVSTSQDRILQLNRQNYYPGFAFGQPAVAAIYLSVGIGVIISFWKNNKASIIVNSLSICFLLIAVFMVGKRSLLIAIIAALPVVYLFSAFGKDIWKRLIVIISATFIVTLLTSIVVPLISDIAFLTRMQNLFLSIISGEFSGSLLVRFNIYSDAWALFLDHPVFGVGWNNFELLTSGYYSRDYEVHNVYLQLLTETGVVGFIIIMAAIIYCYYLTFKSYRETLSMQFNSNKYWSGGLLFSLYYQTVFLLYSFGESPFYHLIHTLFYFFVLTIVGSYLFKKCGVLKNK